MSFTIDVDDRQTMVRLKGLPIAVRAKLLPTIRELTKTLLGRVRAAEPERTGTLRRATQSSVSQGRDFIRGRVSVLPRPGKQARNVVAAAAALEYGVNATFSVRSHRARLSHVFGRRVNNRFIIVDAYKRKVRTPPRRFLRDSLAAMRPQVTAAIERAIAEADL
jgi:hypothetical protein